MKIMKNSTRLSSSQAKHQKTNHKWFDKLTTLSQVEGQIPMTEIQKSKQIGYARH
jgi:hypothetical protein